MVREVWSLFAICCCPRPCAQGVPVCITSCQFCRLISFQSSLKHSNAQHTLSITLLFPSIPWLLSVNTTLDHGCHHTPQVHTVEMAATDRCSHKKQNVLLPADSQGEKQPASYDSICSPSVYTHSAVLAISSYLWLFKSFHISTFPLALLKTWRNSNWVFLFE